MTFTITKLFSGIMLLSALILPSLGMALGASSMAAGVILVSAFSTLGFIALLSVTHQPIDIKARGGILILFIFVPAVVITQSYLPRILYDNFDVPRFKQAIIIFMLFIIGAFSFAHLIKRLTENAFEYSIKFIMICFLISILFGALNYSPFFGSNYEKPVLFHSEPSLFALDFLPFLLFSAVNANSKKRMYFCAFGLIAALVLQNLTLLVGALLVTAIVLGPLLLVILGFIIFLFAYILEPVGFDYYIRRLDLTSDVLNISTLAYFQGWERAYLNILDTFGFGVGFQQFGILGQEGEYQELLGSLNAGGINLLDGGSVGAKLIGEFGVIAIVALLIYLLHFYRTVKMLHIYRPIDMVSPNNKLIFAQCSFIIYFIDLFVRGSGYFTSSGFLFLVSVILIMWNGSYRRTCNNWELHSMLANAQLIRPST